MRYISLFPELLGVAHEDRGALCAVERPDRVEHALAVALEDSLLHRPADRGLGEGAQVVRVGEALEAWVVAEASSVAAVATTAGMMANEAARVNPTTANVLQHLRTT